MLLLCCLLINVTLYQKYFWIHLLDDTEESEVDLDAVEEYCKNHHYLFETVSVKRRPRELREHFKEFLHEVCNSNYNNMMIEKEELAKMEKKSFCNLV